MTVEFIQILIVGGALQVNFVIVNIVSDILKRYSYIRRLKHTNVQVYGYDSLYRTVTSFFSSYIQCSFIYLINKRFI